MKPFASQRYPVASSYSRRRFLGEASCSAIGTTSLLSTLLSLRLTGSMAAAETSEPGDYKALVCIFLAGGNDSFNMLAPVDELGHAEYAQARGEIALPQTAFTPFENSLPSPDGRTLGLQSGMSQVHDLYHAGKAAVVANVGTLLEPTTVAAINQGSADLPLGLFSHSDQQLAWQSATPENRAALTGWGGRMADLLNELNGESQVSMNVSIAGTNLFQSGATTIPLSRSILSVPQLTSFSAGVFLNRRRAIESMVDAEYRNIFDRAIAGTKKQAIAAGEEYRSALVASPEVTSDFSPENPLAQQLKAVAETIAARESLNKRRQTFFVEVGGWDQHATLESHPKMLADLSTAISEFQAAMSELGTGDQVTLFTASDFGRTLSPNGTGTDHAWGGNHLVVGGAVNGGQVYGQYPELSLGSLLDTGRGRIVPTTSVDEYIADLALWMGVPSTELLQVLPNLGRFHDVSSMGPPLGLMTT